MKISHLGFDVVCEQQVSWDGKINSNRLIVTRRKTLELDTVILIDIWWDGKMQAGIKYGVKAVEIYMRASTSMPGKG